MSDDSTFSDLTNVDNLDTTAIFSESPGSFKVGKNLLEVVGGPLKGETCSFDQTIQVGRGDDCDLRINDPSVSRKHLVIEKKGGGYVVTNINSNNFTLLNEQRINTAAISNGDMLRIGDSTIRVSLSDSKSRSNSPRLVRILILVLLLLGGLAVIFIGVNNKKKTPPKTETTVAGKTSPAPTKQIEPAAQPSSNAQSNPQTSTPVKNLSVMDQEKQKQAATEQAARNRKIAVYMSHGKSLYDQGDFVQALGRFQAVLELDPTHAEAGDLAGKARTEIDAAKKRKHEAWLKMQGLKEKISPLFTDANIFMSQKKYAEAKVILEQIITISPTDPESLELLAKVDKLLEKQHLAKKAERQKVEAMRGKLQAQLTKATELEKNGDLAEALKEFGALAALGHEVKEVSAAQAKVEELKVQLLELTREDYEAGLEFFEQEKLKEALESWATALKVYPEHPMILAKVKEIVPELESKARHLYQEGVLYEDLGRYDKARKRYEEILETLPIEESVYWQKASKRLATMQAADKDKK